MLENIIQNSDFKVGIFEHTWNFIILETDAKVLLSYQGQSGPPYKSQINLSCTVQ